MITEDQIRIYLHYDGNEDYFTRCACQEHKRLFFDGDWLKIGSLVQDIIMIRRKLTTKEYAEKIGQTIRKNGLSQETVDLLYNKFEG